MFGDFKRNKVKAIKDSDRIQGGGATLTARDEYKDS